MAPIQSEDAEISSSNPAWLATLHEHYASVNAVRWSNGGTFLASASDDGTAHAYALKQGPAAVVFGSQEKRNSENWVVTRTYRGHKSEIVRCGGSICGGNRII